MRTKVPTRRAASSAHSLDLPLPFRLVTLREAGDAFAHAAAIAAEAGAGTLVQVGRFDTAEFAVVLEPEQPLRLARRVFYIGLCALADPCPARSWNIKTLRENRSGPDDAASFRPEHQQ